MRLDETQVEKRKTKILDVLRSCPRTVEACSRGSTPEAIAAAIARMTPGVDPIRNVKRLVALIGNGYRADAAWILARIRNELESMPRTARVELSLSRFTG